MQYILYSVKSTVMCPFCLRIGSDFSWYSPSPAETHGAADTGLALFFLDGSLSWMPGECEEGDTDDAYLSFEMVMENGELVLRLLNSSITFDLGATPTSCDWTTFGISSSGSSHPSTTLIAFPLPFRGFVLKIAGDGERMGDGERRGVEFGRSGVEAG